MLLGQTATNDHPLNTESLVIQLMWQQRYAEAYELLLHQNLNLTSSLYNMAICLHWCGNYQGALTKLESIRLPNAPHIGIQNNPTADSDYMQIKNKQNQTNDHLLGISDVYLNNFPSSVQDAIIRLKTDCWLQLGNYAKVRAIATPIAHKGYKNIKVALEIA